MKIGINTLFLVPGDVGGTEIYLREDLTCMVKQAPDDIFVLFTTLDNEEVLRRDLDGVPNVEFVQLPFKAAIRPLWIVMEQAVLPFLVWKNRIDSLWSPGYTAPLVCPCPSAVTIHDFQYKSHPDNLIWLERVTLDFLVKNACRRCDVVIAVSEFSKTEILRFGYAGEEKVFTVPEGVDPDFR